MARWLLFFPWLFLLYFSLPCIVSSIVLYAKRFFLTVWVMRDSITAWSARYNSSVTTEILPLIVGAIYVTFYNCLRWSMSRGPCVKHGMIWRHNGLHESRREPMELVAEVVLLKTEGPISGGWISSGRSIPREEKMVSRIFWMMLSRESLGWLSLLALSKDFEGDGHVSWSWCGSEFDHYMYLS